MSTIDIKIKWYEANLEIARVSRGKWYQANEKVAVPTSK